MKEEELIMLAREGDLNAFNQLMKIYFPVVERFAYQLGNPIDSIDDITQEVFLRMYRYFHKYTRGKMTTWLYKLTLNVSRDMYRKRKSNANKFNLLKKQRGNTASESVEENVLKDEQDKDLHMMIQQLNDKYKIPLILFYFHEKKLDEIAEVLNIPVPTVKTRLSRAKKQLQTALKKEGELLVSTDPFEDRMRCLKKSYEQMPSFSSREAILRKLQKQNKKRTKQYWKMPYVASILMVLLVSGVLLASTDIFMSNQNGESNFSEDHGRIVQDRNNEIQKAEEKTDKRPKQLRETIMIEGTEEKMTFNLYKDEVLGFSSYVAKDLKTEQVRGDGINLTNLYVNYTGEVNKSNALNFLWRKDITTKKEMKGHLMANENDKWHTNEEMASVPFKQPVENVFFATRTNENRQRTEIYIFRLKDKIFGVTLRYEPQFAAGFIPRIEKFVKEIRWR